MNYRASVFHLTCNLLSYFKHGKKKVIQLQQVGQMENLEQCPETLHTFCGSAVDAVALLPYGRMVE